jgi:hypothetical protein
MERTPYKPTLIITLVISSLILCGCNEELQLHPIYQQAITGAIVGGIIGYQSEEPGEGAALGAVVLGVGALLEQTDKGTCSSDNEEEYSDEDFDSPKEVFVVNVHNSNGSITPVEIEKREDAYFGPKGELYEQLPTEEQLKPVYGF